MEFAPQTAGEPQERSLGEPSAQTATAASRRNTVLRGVIELVKLSEIKNAFLQCSIGFL